MRIFMIVPALILISCKGAIAPKPAGKVVDSVKVVDTIPKIDTTVEYKSHQSKQFSFAYKKKLDGNVRQLIIRNVKTDSLIQEILLTDESVYTLDDFPYIKDLNFDGFEDFYISTNIGSKGNCAYIAYLYLRVPSSHTIYFL